MTAVTRPRGPLPKRVYWFRRLLVVALAVGLVVGIAQLLGRGTGSADPEPDKASPVAGSPVSEPTRTATTQSTRPADEPDRPARKRDRKERKPQLARPTGPCADSDVLITPTIGAAYAGQPVKVLLELTTVEAEACYWTVDAEAVLFTVEGEDGAIWSTRDCPAAVPTKDVVPRREKAATVVLWWDGTESGEGCTRESWVFSGTYRAVAVARGSVTPIETGFVLAPAPTPTITRTVTPTPTASGV